MTRNLIFSTLGYAGISAIVYALSSLIDTHFQTNPDSKVQLLYFIPLLIITLISFLFVGRFTLSPTGSTVKNIVSVLLVAVLGLLCELDLLLAQTSFVNPIRIYFSYDAPFWGVVYTLGLEQVREFSSIAIGIIFSLIPSLLFWCGLQWKERAKGMRVYAN